MELYNKIMRMFWLVFAIGTFAIVTVMGFKNGFDRWVHFYVLSFIAFGMFLFKTWMMRRMAKHLEYLASQKDQDESVGK
jgi:hypothetical protein